MKLNKKKMRIIIATLFVAIITAAVLCYVFIFRVPSANEIFKNSINSIVELKVSDETTTAYGTAVFINNNGTLVSNAHLVSYKKNGVYQEFKTFEIRFSYENDYHEVSLIKYDLDEDISFLKFGNNENNISYSSIKTSDSDSLSYGNTVYAIGNALNHGLSITKGIISIPTINIEYNDYTRKVIQCDLMINEGNSGGALLNEKGDLIGITTFRLKDSSYNVIYGMAFAIPINTVLSYLDA